MKVLWLTNSDDLGAGKLPDDLRSYRLAAQRFHELTGEPAEMTARVIWPSPALPDIIDGWIERYEPQMVVFRINGFWYLYRSIPLQLERKLGRAAEPVARAGLKLAELPWITHTGAFHLARRVLLRTVGGATYFSGEEIVGVVERCMRRIVQHEEVSLVVRGQISTWTQGPPGIELSVHDQLQALCEDLHVHYLGDRPGQKRVPEDFYSGGDRLHTSDAGHRWFAEREAAAMANAWWAQQGRVTAGPPASGG
ncbi:MAG: hypothetical protein ACR2HN_07880 [Tepidiformaceae bacterium]